MKNINAVPDEVKITNLNPYIKNKAADYNAHKGIQTESCYDVDGGKNIWMIKNDNWIKFSSLDFGEGASSFEARVSSASTGGHIEIRLDSPDGKLVGSLVVTGTNGWQNWVTNTCQVSDTSGFHDIYFKFTGNRGFLFNFNWWIFKK